MLNDPTAYSCMLCVHYELRSQCKAFPDGIPDDIINSYFIHTIKHPQQKNDLIFERANIPDHVDDPEGLLKVIEPDVEVK